MESWSIREPTRLGASLFIVSALLCCVAVWENRQSGSPRTLEIEKTWKVSKLTLVEAENSVVHEAIGTSLSAQEQHSLLRQILDDSRKKVFSADCSHVRAYEKLEAKLAEMERKTLEQNSTLANRMNSLRSFERLSKKKWESDLESMERNTILLFDHKNALDYAATRLVWPD